MRTVFISYASEDVMSAKRLFNDLSLVSGLKPWIDKEDLLPGMKWQSAIRHAIRKADFFAMLLSTKSVSKKGFVQKELREALDILEEFPEGQIFILPIRLEPCETSYDRLQEIQYVDFFPHWDSGFQTLLKAISSYTGSSQFGIHSNPIYLENIRNQANYELQQYISGSYPLDGIQELVKRHGEPLAKEIIVAAYKHKGNIRDTARLFGVSDNLLRMWCHNHGIRFSDLRKEAVMRDKNS